MKAKHFTKLRKKAIYFDVQHSSSLFGEFKYDWHRGITVLAKTPKQAILRAKRRGYGLRHSVDGMGVEQWAKWRVKRTDKSGHFKNIVYFD